MAQQKTISFKGIQRAIPQSLAPDGACQEIINLRPKKGCWRPIGTKKEHKAWDLSAYDNVWVHDIENGIVPADGIFPGQPNYIGYKKGTGILYTIHRLVVNGVETGPLIETPIVRQATPGQNINVVFLKRTMVVTDDNGVGVFLFTSEKAYIQTASLPVPDVDISESKSFSINSSNPDTSVSAHSAKAILGNLYAALNEKSSTKGAMFGSIMYIVAYRLFDGNYILHSLPRYLSVSNHGKIYQRNPSGGDQDDSLWWFSLTVKSLKATINNELYPSSIKATKDLIESICIFATKATPLHKIDETTLTDTKLLQWFARDTNNRDFNYMFQVSPDFQKLAKSPGWYKIHEFAFEDVVGKTGRTTKEVDTKGFYQDYATRETLPADQFTHHLLTAREAYVYNDRLHLANIKTSMGLPYVIWPDSNSEYVSVPADDKTGKVSVWLKTSIGQTVIQKQVSIPYYRIATEKRVVCGTYEQAKIFIAGLPTNSSYPNYVADSAYFEVSYIQEDGTGQVIDEYTVVFKNATGSTYYLLLPEIVGYNDARAYKMQITVEISGATYQIFSETLIKNELMNFAYWHNTTFSNDPSNANVNYPISKTLVSDVVANYQKVVPPTVITLPFDTNRLQVSEIQNPLIFPAKNSYQIGTGDIIKICAGSEPLSTGQFGRFPLQVFTSKGIWALEIGTGDVLYSNVLPVNSEVVDNGNNVISLSQGVCYTTDTGLFVINGRQVVELSEIIEQPFNNFELSKTTEVQNLVTDARFVNNLSNSLRDISFMEYLNDSKIGYDYANKELFVTNILYGYSYVYSFENQVWYKISTSYRTLVNSYPKLLALTNSNIVSISDELDVNPVDCLIISAAQSFESPDAYKKIERAILRGLTHSGISSQVGFYVFASNDLVTWQYLLGNQRSGTGIKDFLVQRSHGSAKYYAFVFAGRITTSSEIKQIELIFNIKWNNRLR